MIMSQVNPVNILFFKNPLQYHLPTMFLVLQVIVLQPVFISKFYMNLRFEVFMAVKRGVCLSSGV